MKLFPLLLILFTQVSLAQNLVGYTFLSGSKQTPFQLALYPFTTDGCSRYQEGPQVDPTRWEHCCVSHDVAYWLGGTEDERLNADIELRECVAASGHRTQAQIMYAGTRLGGGPLRHTTYRWGYGWNRVRDYHELTEQEKEMAFSMYGENLVDLKNAIDNRQYKIEVPQSYKFESPFEYTFCEESIINHLTPLLSQPTTVVSQALSNGGGGVPFSIKLQLDLCEAPLLFVFSKNTSLSTCKKDYAESDRYNKITRVDIPSSCKEKLKIQELPFSF